MNSRSARTIVLGMLRNLRGGELRVVESGRQTVLGRPSSLVATVTIRDPRAWSAFLRGSFGLAASYRDGWWDCDDLVALTRIAARNVHGLDRLRAWIAPVWHPVQRTARRVHAPTIGRSRRQIAAHYDLGNDLFALFLDETMSYSAGFFDRRARRCTTHPSPSSMRSATSSPSVPTIICWRSVPAGAASRARRAALRLPRDDHHYFAGAVRPCPRARRLGGPERSRHGAARGLSRAQGTYDKLVSIEMIEAVGAG